MRNSEGVYTNWSQVLKLLQSRIIRVNPILVVMQCLSAPIKELNEDLVSMFTEWEEILWIK